MAKTRTRKPLEILTRRTDRVEQILPTLPTKDDLRQAIAEAVEPLATKVELHQAIAEAVEPLATKVELHQAIAEAVEPLATKAELRDAIREEGDRVRRHMSVLIEHQDGEIQLVAEHVLTVMKSLDAR